jgi:hypothetical protein
MSDRIAELEAALKDATDTLLLIKREINEAQNARIRGERANWRKVCDFAFNEIDGRAEDLASLLVPTPPPAKAWTNPNKE